ncbi:MAG: hypothetical protein Q9215_003370 [Flavoplaca cf. flavocitrina]
MTPMVQFATREAGRTADADADAGSGHEEQTAPQWKYVDEDRNVSESDPFQDVDLALNITSEGTGTVVLLFGQPDQALNFTTEHRHVKRAINYHEAVCKGGELWNMIQEAFEGRRPPGPNFGPNELSNGWTESPISGGLGGLPPGWDPAFATFSGVGGRAPAESQIKNLLTSQDKPFRNAQGTQVQLACGTSATTSSATPKVDQILKATYNTNTPNIAWPGLQASISTDPGKALLATPNGVGVAWLLMDRAGVLGRRLPVARVWNANGFRCMLWDLVPQ